MASAYLFTEFFKGFWTATQVWRTFSGDRVGNMEDACSTSPAYCSDFLVPAVLLLSVPSYMRQAFDPPRCSKLALSRPASLGMNQNVESPPAAVLDLLVDANYGKCNVVFVGIVPSAAQKQQLQDYSRKFNVRDCG